MSTIQSYVIRRSITVEILAGPILQREGDWQHYLYQLRLVRPHAAGKGATVESKPFDWKQGLGIKTSPEDTPAEVLDALISDATAYTNARDFADFAAEFGYDEDSRKAYALYEECGKVAKWLAAFLGGKAVLDAVAAMEGL